MSEPPVLDSVPASLLFYLRPEPRPIGKIIKIDRDKFLTNELGFSAKVGPHSCISRACFRSRSRSAANVPAGNCFAC